MTATNVSGRGSCVVPISLENNVTKLYAYFFGSEDHTTSETVQSISARITELTGVKAGDLGINTDSYNNTAGQDGTVFE